MPPPLAYRFVRFLFKVSSNAFYAVEVDGLENIPPDGCPTILCPNHSNSLTDPILLLSTVPPEKRDMIRMTAKDTLWHKTDFFSLLIKGVGTIPIKRSKDYNNTRVDNTSAIETLVETVEQGSCVCLFPEGISRYHSQIANFKPGVALIASEILTRNKDKENFSVNLLTVSLVYNHREKFRSNVLVKFNPPIVITPKHQNLLKTITEDGRKRSSEQAINELTNAMEEIIRSNTLDSPDWKTLRIAHTARKLYAGELGTRISFSEYIKLTKKFIDLLAKVRAIENGDSEGSSDDNNVPNVTNLLDEKEFIVERVDAGNLLMVDNPETSNDKISHQGIDLATLASDLTVYQDRLDSLGIKDYRFSQSTPLSKPALLFRIYLRVIWATFLATISIPGWILWSPVFIAVKYKEHQIRQLPIVENFDEIAQYKLLISAILLVPIYLTACFFTLPFILITSWLIPLLMWLTIRWTEDLFQSMRSCISLTKLLFLSPSGYSNIRIMRENIRARVQVLAVHDLGLPENPEDLIGKARPRGMGYFSIRRRRKKDYNEVLRLWDVSAFE